MNDKGDVFLIQTPDGFDINVDGGIVEMTTGFETAVLLSLLGGNQEDNGTLSTLKKEWWGNKLENNNPERKMTSRFQNLIYGLPSKPGNLKKLEEAGKQDLQWFITEKIADTVNFVLTLIEKNKLNVFIELIKDESKLFETQFSINWESQFNGT